MPSDGADTRAWVLHPDIPNQDKDRDPSRALEEAVSLAHALPGIEVCGGTVVRLTRPHPGMFFGKGKVEELKAQVEAEELELVLIDGPVTPVQQRNLEKALGVKLLDRTGLILEIFSDRAATREGVLQVEMAALSYQRTRLVRAWTHLERQRGGLGFVGGPGETQIEADRRAIDEQLVRLRRQFIPDTRVVTDRGHVDDVLPRQLLRAREGGHERGEQQSGGDRAVRPEVGSHGGSRSAFSCRRARPTLSAARVGGRAVVCASAPTESRVRVRSTLAARGARSCEAAPWGGLHDSRARLARPVPSSELCRHDTVSTPHGWLARTGWSTTEPSGAARRRVGGAHPVTSTGATRSPEPLRKNAPSSSPRAPEPVSAAPHVRRPARASSRGEVA